VDRVSVPPSRAALCLVEAVANIEAFMRDLAHLETGPGPEEAYDRHKKWLPFAHRNRAFFEASAKDLGYELEGGPGERLF
jgi:hypothetical protein